MSSCMPNIDSHFSSIPSYNTKTNILVRNIYYNFRIFENLNREFNLNMKLLQPKLS